LSDFPYQAVREKLEGAEAITILSHLNPDADALGTSLGIYALLKANGHKRVEVVNASNLLPLSLDFLPNFTKIKSSMDYGHSLIIACDCGNIERLGVELTSREIINIDHHKSNTDYGLINVVKPSYASSSQVAYRLFQEIYPMDAKTATCFYTALLSDTKYFTASSVDKEVFALAGELIALGANPETIASSMTQRKPLSALRILQKALASLTLYHEARIAVLHVSKEEIAQTGAKIPDLEGIVEYANSLVTVEIALFLMELEGGIRVSVRSKDLDVSRLALAFGGGGHQVASGFTLKQCELHESIDIILKKIEYLRIIR